MRRALAIAVGALAVILAGGCGPATPATQPASSARAQVLLPDVRRAKDRPPVVLVVREGDPSGAVAVAVTTGALEGNDDDPEIAVALAAVVEARLAAKGFAPSVVPSWSGFRAAVLVAAPDAAAAATDAVREALTASIDDRDVVAAKKKLAALAARPLRDASLARWARCVGSPHALPARAGKSGDDLAAARLEKWRAAAHGLGRVAVAVAGPSATAESVASAVARGPAWKAAAPPPPPATAPSSSGTIDVDVYEAAAEMSGNTLIHATLDVGTASDAVSTAEALGDPHGPLASRLAALDLPFRLREVVAAAEPRGGCVGMVLESAAAPSPAAAPGDLATRVADAVALVHVEAQVHLGEGGTGPDGRTLARRAGDAREAAERAAWWALADSWTGPGTATATATATATSVMRGSVALGIPLRRGSSPNAEGALEPSREVLASAVARAALSWQKPVAEGRVRVEPGQGETWVLIASPCGADGESDADAGLTALFTMAVSEMAKSSPDARVEPWVVPDGAGLLAHGPASSGETASAQARRLADVVARSFASEPIASAAVTRARAGLLHHDVRADGPALGLVAAAIAPGHASWFDALGREDTLARSADASVLARGQALRAGPLRVAVLANVDAAQGDAALRAADRWIDRRFEGARACRPSTPAAAPRAGTYAIEPRNGAAPEAYLAFPFAAGDEKARAAATLLAAALDGDGGLLDKAFGGTNGALARSWSSRVVGWPRAPALVLRIVSTQVALDNAVMQARALVDRLKKSGLAAPDHDRATAAAARDAVAIALDPRARIVATWRGEPIASSAQPFPRGRAGIEDVRAFAAKYLGEESMVVVAARPPRVKPGAATP
ncbi:MAG: exonuclease SbcC [Myxococcaceae bacterium]|nr:exonuclease SbcC [Myxococcaceae bacterium]